MKITGSKTRQRKPRRRVRCDPHRQTRTTSQAARVLGLTVKGTREAALAGEFDYVMQGTRMYLLVPSIERKLGGRSLVEIEQQMAAVAPE